MKTKDKNGIWYIALCVAAVLTGLLIQLGLSVMEGIQSRNAAELAAESFLAQAQTLAADEQARDEALRKKLAAASSVAFERKEERRAQLALLTLVNPWNEVPEGYVPVLESIGDEQQVDVRCAADLLRMLDDCRAAGCEPIVCSSYRTQEMQEFLYNNKIQRLLNEGVGWYDAPEVAARSVAIPGTSEHQLGLAVDIIDEDYQLLNYWQERTATQQWLMANCHKYGFILRYPNGTTDITGIIYEPWHYRYVGAEVAAEITELGITFEEYLPLRRGR